MVNLLQSVACAIGSGGDDVKHVLPAPVCSLEELDDLCTKLVDETLKRKLVRTSCMILDVKLYFGVLVLLLFIANSSGYFEYRCQIIIIFFLS